MKFKDNIYGRYYRVNKEPASAEPYLYNIENNLNPDDIPQLPELT